jgi:outer membrane lipoprotein-sorting protein
MPRSNQARSPVLASTFYILHSTFFLVCLLFGLLPSYTGFAQNKYDVLAKTLQPYAELFTSKSKTKALSANLLLLKTASSKLLNLPVHLSFEMPDKLRIETSNNQQRMILCRNGQRIWVYPKTLADQWLAAVKNGTSQNDESTTIPDFRLPFTDTQIALFPILFKITQYESMRDEKNRPVLLLGFHLIPQIAPDATWGVRAVVRQKHGFDIIELAADHAGPWTGKLRVLNTDFSEKLPASTWEPDPKLQPETEEIPPHLFQPILEALKEQITN